MYQIDDTYAASSLPALPTDNVGTPGYFQGSNAAVGQPATRIRFWWLNMIQEELRAVVLAAGIVLAKGTNNQVLTAIQSLISTAVGNYLPLAGGNVTGAVNLVGGAALSVTGNVAAGSMQSAGDLYSSAYFLAGPTNGNFTPCQSAATGASLSGGQVNAYNQAGSSGQFGTASAGDLVDFYVGNVGTISIQGKITTTGTGVVYGTTSDYRIKQDVVPLTGALDRLSLLQAKRFAFKSAPDKTVDGFLAHEAAAVVADAVAGDKDGVRVHQGAVVSPAGAVLADNMTQAQFAAAQATETADGKSQTPRFPAGANWQATLTVPVVQIMDASRLMPVLWAAVGELHALVLQQARQIASLTADQGALKS